MDLDYSGRMIVGSGVDYGGWVIVEVEEDIEGLNGDGKRKMNAGRREREGKKRQRKHIDRKETSGFSASQEVGRTMFCG